jgi:methionyl-tRNA formyltransferase
MISKRITILVDNDSWVLPYAQELEKELAVLSCPVRLIRESKDIDEGWINFMLGCTRIVGADLLKKNQHNLVVHESDLPRGRGFAPMAWQIIEGKNEIPICLIEAEAEADTGVIWIKDEIKLSGTELCDEWRVRQGEKTVELCKRFVTEYGSIIPHPQEGEPSWYPRRRPADSRLDVKISIEEQFNLLRTVDSERYPAFFDLAGRRYLIKIEPVDSVNSEK